MTLDQLRIFIAVAEREHITHAATALNMTQSAVSAAITALENRHGVVLFDRIGRSIVLNQTGRVFLKEAIAVVARAKAAEAALTDLAGLMRGELSIMASQTIAGYWLPERLGAYRKRYPGITLDIRIGNTKQVAEAVEAGEAELGFVEGKVDHALLSTKIVATDDMVIVVASGQPWAAHRTVEAKDFRDVAWVLREKGSGTRSAFDQLLGSVSMDVSMLEIAMELPGNEAVIGAVEAGVGATLISRSVASSKLRAKLLRQVAYPTTPRPFYLLHHRERYYSKAADAFVSLVDAKV
ncbi:LysR family transcriptional regulator [Phyllobacterium sp. OV277]|uniref:LysR family transcriptional regulator n=1 Tax=Phyllobacterium sp. OV277 TaxID=1882772 RepID=UPI0008855DE8|nr:LysR family transcriptional regulator [Phyllobacterium sp. OV277]SDN89136.1 DNA-binding transcriptional regulator, LysR family [Phyllobacterium sp. OV277]